MAKVFVSYSRKDIEFAKRLTAELQKSDLDFWIDWEGIPPTVDWWREIEKGIEEANVFLFLISPDSAKSKVCGQEIDAAVKNGKRIIPIVVRDIVWEDTPKHLGHLNYIFFREGDDFAAAIQKLITAIQTDYEWTAAHRRLQVKALEWERNKKENGFLLRGKDLHDAESQLASNTSKEPHPTDLQRAYVFESRKATDRQRRITMGLSIAGIIALAALAVFGLVQARNATHQATMARVARDDAQAASTLAVSNASTAVANAQEARRQTGIARARELATLAILKRPNNYALSTLLGLEVFHRMPDLLSTRGVVLNNAQANPQLIQYLARHTSFVYSVAFSPDGKLLASGSEDHTIILWDVDTRQPIAQLPGQSGAYSIAFSPDGRILASGNVDGTILLWDVTTGTIVGTPLTGHTKGVDSVAFSPDGKTLVSAGADGNIILWDVSTHQSIGDPLTGHEGAVWKVSISPDGTTLVSGGSDYSVRLWDVKTRQALGDPLNGHNGTVWTVTFSPDGKTIASGSDDKTILLWDVATRLPSGEALMGPSGVYSLTFSPDGKTLVSGNADNNILLWDVETHQTIGQPLMGHSNWVNSVAFRPDGTMLASGSEDNTIILWDTATRPSVEEPLTGPGAVYGVAFSPDGKTLAAAGDERTIVLWDAMTRQPLGQPFTGHTDAIWRISFSPAGKMLASASADKTVILWDVATHLPIGKPLTGHTATVWTVAFSPDGKTLASGSSDGTAILWDVATGQPIGQPLVAHEGGIVYGVAFSPDGKTLASAQDDATIILWNVETRQPIGEPLAGNQGGALYSVVFSPDGKTLASGGDDGTISLWDVETRQEMGQPLVGHSAIYSIVFSPDGKTIASGTLDGTINVWDEPTGEAVGQPLTGHSDWVNSMAFSPDGKILASGSADGTIILWTMNPQAWVAGSCQRVGRNFTLAEWTLYFPSEVYHQTCKQWPAASDETAALAAIPTVGSAGAQATPTSAVEATSTSSSSTYTEEFDGEINAWSPFMTTGILRQLKTVLGDGSFRIELSPFEDKIPWAFWVNDSFTYTDVQLQAVVTNNGNNANGVSLVCQYSDYGWYEFTISSAGLYSIYAFDRGVPPVQGHVALATGGSSAIKNGKATNTYTAVCKGNELSLYVNDSLVKTVTDAIYHFTEGKIGFGASSPQRLPVDVQFESLTVSLPK